MSKYKITLVDCENFDNNINLFIEDANLTMSEDIRAAVERHVGVGKSQITKINMFADSCLARLWSTDITTMRTSARKYITRKEPTVISECTGAVIICIFSIAHMFKVTKTRLTEFPLRNIKTLRMSVN